MSPRNVVQRSTFTPKSKEREKKEKSLKLMKFLSVDRHRAGSDRANSSYLIIARPFSLASRLTPTREAHLHLVTSRRLITGAIARCEPSTIAGALLSDEIYTRHTLESTHGPADKSHVLSRRAIVRDQASQYRIQRIIARDAPGSRYNETRESSAKNEVASVEELRTGY